MVDYEYADLYTKDSVDKQVHIDFDGGTITNTELFSESMTLTESLCSQSELQFGCCEASVLKFKVANIMIPLHGKWLTVSETLGGNTDVSFSFGKYKVFSDKPTADRKHREIVAYDAMYDIINEEMSDWYNALLPNEDSTVTMKEFRTSFISYFGLEQEEVSLINDDMVVERTITPSKISGKDIITAICEINGCFGHIGRDGKFHYVLLPKYIQGLYPAKDLYPADDLFPREQRTEKISNSLYISCEYEDFIAKNIDKLQIRQEENDIGAIVGTGTNCYIVEDNFLVYGKSAADLETIATNLFSVITDISYRPFKADCKGNPCYEVGDAVRLTTKYKIVETYILKRTLKGIQALRDTYSADGVEEYSEKVNSLNRQILQLKGKTNVLERTVEETKSQITDVEAGLQSTITQTAEEIKSEVSATYETQSNAKSAYSTLQSSITQTATQISSKVSKGSIISEINQSAEVVSINAEKININGAASLNDYFVVNTDGSVTLTKGTFRVETASSNENLIYFKSDSDSGEVSAGMGSYGFIASYGGYSSTHMWHGLEIPGGGYLDYKDGKAMVGATEGYIGTLVATTGNISTLTLGSEPVVTSDKRLKKCIKSLDKEETAEFIYSLNPCQFKYKDGTRYHHGLIAQEVKEAMGKRDWGLYVDCGEKVALRYGELITDLILVVQSQNERIKALEEREGKRWLKCITERIGRIFQAMSRRWMRII